MQHTPLEFLPAPRATRRSLSLAGSALLALGLLLCLGCRSAPEARSVQATLEAHGAYTTVPQTAAGESRGETQVAAPAWPPIVVLLVRHGEKAGGDDPALTEAGVARATELKRLLGGAEVTHLFASPAQRARLTATPLAESLGLPIETYQVGQLEAHAAALRALPPGSVALSVGHSNTVPALAALLGSPIEGLSVDPRFGPLLPESEHDRLVMLLLPAHGQGAARSLELRFGK